MCEEEVLDNVQEEEEGDDGEGDCLGDREQLVPNELPKDKRRLVGLTFFYLGLCTMLPWNFLLSITSFWDYKFRNVSLDNVTSDDVMADARPTPLQVAFPGYVAIASNVPGAITTLAHSFLGQRMTVHSRVLYSLCLLVFCFSSLLAISTPVTDAWQDRYLNMVIFAIILVNVGVNLLQGTLFGVSGRFPPHYAGYVMMGQAMGGVLPASAAVVLLAVRVPAPGLGPACFAAVLVCLLAAIIALRHMADSAFFLYFAEGASVHSVSTFDKVDYGRVLRSAWSYLATGFLVYAVNLSVYPGLTSLGESVTRSDWSKTYFVPVVGVLLYNVSDLIGRSAATWLQWPSRTAPHRMALLAFAVARIGLIPLVAACNVSPATRHSSVLFSSDAAFCVLVFVLASSAGYVGNLCLMHAPKMADGPEQQEAVSLVLTALFVLGQATGSLASVYVLELI